MIQTLLEPSLRGGAFILVLLLIRWGSRGRISGHVFYGMWIMVLLRLMVPWNLPILIPWNEPGMAEPQVEQAGNAVRLEVPLAKTGAAEGPSLGLEEGLILLWAAGAAVVILITAGKHLRFLRQANESLPGNTEFLCRWKSSHPLRRAYAIRVSDQISGPVTCGLIHPRIILPQGMDASEEEMELILAHEWVHIRRLDLLFQYGLVLCRAIHWFNPLVWLMADYARRDLERSCDEVVLRGAGREQRKRYAWVLLRFSVPKTELGAWKLNLSVFQNELEERIVCVMKKRKFSLIALILSGALLITAVGAFAAEKETAPEEQDPQTAEITSIVEQAEEETPVKNTGDSLSLEGVIYYNDGESGEPEEGEAEEVEEYDPDAGTPYDSYTIVNTSITSTGFSWTQPEGNTAYRIWVNNTRDIPVKVTVSYGSKSYYFYVSANSGLAYTVNNAWQGTVHTVDFSTSDGAVSGTAAVRVSSAAF